MKKPLFILLPVILLVSLACNVSLNLPAKISNTIWLSSSGKQVTQERQVSVFDQVELRSIGNITITQGDQESLSITADENIIDHLTSDVRNGKLILSTEDNYNFGDVGEIRYDLTVKDLKEVDLTGFGNIDIDGLNSDRFAVRLSGSGDLRLSDLSANSLDLTISGFGSADVSGAVSTQSVSISGSGSYNAGDLQSDSADVTVSGFGNATVSAADTLNVVISGSGNISYYGKPTITQKITGFGQLENKGTRQ